YAIQTYTPTVLLQQGYASATAFLLTAIIVVASIPGKYAAAFAVERFGRKATLIWFTGAAAVAAVLFGLLHNPVLSLSCGIILAFFGIGVDPVIKIYGSQQYRRCGSFSASSRAISYSLCQVGLPTQCSGSAR